MGKVRVTAESQYENVFTNNDIGLLLNSLPGTLWRARPRWPAPSLAAVNEGKR